MAMRIPLKAAKKLGLDVPKKSTGRASGTRAARVDREEQFRILWRQFRVGWPEPEAQHVFHPTRKWRFDFAWPDLQVAVEIHGGVFQKGPSGHRSIAGMVADMEKINAAQVLGWIVIQLHANDLDKRPVMAIQTVTEGLQIQAKRLGKPLPFPVLPE